jgi:hypothetical protein
MNFDFLPPYAVGTSHGIVSIVSLSACVGYAIKRQVNYKIGVAGTIITVPLIILGVYLVQIINPNIYKIIFSLMLIFISLNLLFRIFKISPDAQALRTKLALVLFFLACCYAGLTAGFLGIGGGVIFVPVLILLLGLAAQMAVATSQMIIFTKSLIAFIIFFLRGQVDLMLVILIGSGIVFGVITGVIISKNVRHEFIKKALAVFILIIAIRILTTLT